MATTTINPIFRINFDVYNNTLTLTDLAQYSSFGSGVKGIFTCVDPDGVIFYQNSGFATNNFSSPDINSGTSTWSKVLSSGNFPLDTSTNFVKLGGYMFYYKVSLDGGSGYTEVSRSFNMDYVRPYPQISVAPLTYTRLSKQSV